MSELENAVVLMLIRCHPKMDDNGGTVLTQWEARAIQSGPSPRPAVIGR